MSGPTLHELMVATSRAHDMLSPELAAARKMTPHLVAGYILRKMPILEAIELVEDTARLLRAALHQEKGPEPVRLRAVGRDEG